MKRLDLNEIGHFTAARGYFYRKDSTSKLNVGHYFSPQTGVSDEFPRPLSSVGDVCADGQFDGRGVGPSTLMVIPQSSSSSTIVDNLFCSSAVKASFLLLLLFFALDLLLKQFILLNQSKRSRTVELTLAVLL